jgi:chaperonin GroEL (HSP60 family)
MENSVVVQDYAQIDRILKEERKCTPFLSALCSLLSAFCPLLSALFSFVFSPLCYFTSISACSFAITRYVIDLIKPIIKSGCNVLLIQKSILRDAVNDLSLSLLAKKKIMVIKDVERSDVEFISQTLGCTPVADADAMTPSKLGMADLAEEVSTPSGSIVKVTGVKNQVLLSAFCFELMTLTTLMILITRMNIMTVITLIILTGQDGHRACARLQPSRH